MDKEQDKKAYAHAEKAYMHGTMFPYIKVGMQKVNLTPTVNIVNGEKVATPNAPVYIYDTSGPFSDPDIEIDLKKGLPRMRESWITGRGDVEQLPSLPNTEKCGVTTKAWTTCASSTSPCPIAPKQEKPLHRWHTPKPESLHRKWNM